MAILITGGMGLVGAELARRLVGKGKKVVLFDIAPIHPRVFDLLEDLEIIKSNLSNFSEVLNVIRDYEIEGIFHLGGLLSVACEENPWACFQVNVCGTNHILEGARLFGVQKVVFASTQATYGIGVEGGISDDTIQRPTLVYGIGKLYCELMGMYYRNRFGLDFRSIRYPSIVGPGVKTKGVAQYNSWMIEEALFKQFYECPVTEDTITPIMYYKDAALCADMLYEASKESIKTVNYNVGGVMPVMSAKDLAQAIKKHIPAFKVRFVAPEQKELYEDFNIYSVDDQSAFKEWGWQSKYSDLDILIEDFHREIKLNPKQHGYT